MTNNETLADIVAEMRDTCGDIADHEVADYADRIEAAATTKQSSAVGNAAALREALVKTLDAFKSGAIRTEWNDPDSWKHDDELWYLKNDIESALAAPARNCDRFATWKDAWDAFAAAYFGPTDPGEMEYSFGVWLFAKSQEAPNGQA